MRDCTTCPNKDYCIPDECEQLGTKKMPSRTAMRKGHIEKYPFKVYHIIKAKGNTAMIELKITVNTAEELSQEVKDLYQSIVVAPVKDVEPANWTTCDVKPDKKDAPKVEVPAPKVEPVKEEAPAHKEEEAATPTVEPAKAGEPKVEAPSLEATREAVKDVMAKAADKTKAKGEFKAFLDSIGAEKVTSATDEQRIQIMEWVNSRG
ncbi:hypothetical protein [Veillonella caviae]|uniref:hypothetical protein n=1 Tax=Veillonella caviae TaxID=248316 RepID=UPI0023F4AF7F|nr:hypothetical protein [Veillonella caviae]MCI6408014.1 hypothetical protein [Veillonella caviae]MDY6225271.1 hypothetical protein [Veillonella caviae]